MTRWFVEKSGSGIEKAGSGIEKAGSGIEKAGSGIEKAGSGIEKAGSGLRKALIALTVSAISLSNVHARDLDAEGALQIVSSGNMVAVSWIIDGSVFAGVAQLAGTYANLRLTEVGLATDIQAVEVAGSGTGKEVAGSGTGKQVAGSGTGIEVAGSGTGTDVAGSGTGTDVAGSGTGTDVAGSGTGTDVAGSGTGTQVAGSGTGQDSIDPATTIMIAGSGTGSDAISITLPEGTGLQMEITMSCSTAMVSVYDSSFAEVVTFNNVQVIGNTGLCNGYGTGGFNFAGVPIASNTGIK